MGSAEITVENAVQTLRLVVEATGGVVVAIGFLVAGVQFLVSLVRNRGGNFTAIRLVLARYLALALEFQLGADILSTAVSPGWEQIGKLAAIAIIRTTLNYFLNLEIRGERATEENERHVQKEAAAPG